MIQVKCNKVGHLESLVCALCLRQDCEQDCAYCTRCVQGHLSCGNQLKFLEDVPEIVQQRKILRDWFRDMFKYIMKQILQIEQIISEHFQPINEYESQPTLTNLNKLGQILKDQRPLDIQGLEMRKQSILLLFYQFKDIILNKNGQQIQQIDSTLVQKEQENLGKKCFDEGMKLFDNKLFSEAIVKFDQSIGSDEDNVDSWQFKGNSLYKLKKYQQAIQCFDQCIKINPSKQDSYYSKGRSLQYIALKKYEESIECFDQQIKIKPHYWSYKYKGRALEQQQLFKEAEQCYHEGLKHFPEIIALKTCLSFVQQIIKIQKQKIKQK